MNGAFGSGRNYHLFAIGDSIISGVGAPTQEKALVGQTAKMLSELLSCRINWAVCGSIGANSNRVITELIPRLPDKEVDFMVLSVGVNDITGLSGLWKWERNLGLILKALARHSPNAIIAVSGIPPLRGFPLLPQPLRALFGIRGKTFDISCRRVVLRHPFAIHVPVDFDPQPDKFSPDGYHPSEKSYHEFGRLTARLMAEKYNENLRKVHF